jgi:hypothetical protein
MVAPEKKSGNHCLRRWCYVKATDFLSLRQRHASCFLHLQALRTIHRPTGCPQVCSSTSSTANILSNWPTPPPLNSLQNSPQDKLQYVNKLALLVLEWITDFWYDNGACTTSWHISCLRYHCGQDMFGGWGLGVQPSPIRNYMNDINSSKHSGNKYTTALTFSNSAFCPQSVFMGFIHFQNKQPIFPHTTLTNIMETLCVCFEVGDEILNSIIWTWYIKRLR